MTMSNSATTNPTVTSISVAESPTMLSDRRQARRKTPKPRMLAKVGIGVLIVIAAGSSAGAEWTAQCHGCDAAVPTKGAALNDGAPRTHRLKVAKNTAQAACKLPVVKK